MVLSIMLFSYEEYVDENPYLGICRLVMDTKYHTLSVEIECFPSIFPYQIFYKCLSNKHIEFSFKGNMNIYIYIYRITLFIELMNDDDGYPEPKAY
jgi:hypothetical protein